MLRILVLFLSIIIPTNIFAFPKIPNVSGDLCTESNKDFYEFRYKEKIPYCQRNVSSREKRKIYEAYSIPLKERKNYTIDHIVCLSIGGSNDSNNLWPESRTLKKHRGSLEYHLYYYLKKGKITQKCAIEVIKDSKYDEFLLQKPSYNTYNGFFDYLRKRKKTWKACNIK